MITIKRTTVYISMGDKTQVFRTPEDIPDSLRKQLVESTRGMNSATILIADRGGRAEIRKILNGEPSQLKGRLRSDYLKQKLGESASIVPNPATAVSKGWSPRNWGWRQWAELILPGAIGLGFWLFFTWK